MLPPLVDVEEASSRKKNHDRRVHFGGEDTLRLIRVFRDDDPIPLTNS